MHIKNDGETLGDLFSLINNLIMNKTKGNKMGNIEEASGQPAALARPTVMVVDDTDINLMMMESILAEKYSLKLFSEAKVALDDAFANPPDLILLDIMMPDIDGFEACRRLKANPVLADIPVIFITAKNEDEYEEQGFSVGASDFIHKPVNVPILLARVETHLKLKLVMDYLRKENTRLQGKAKHSPSELLEVIKILWGSSFIKF